jgi:hypothetical protein
MRESTLWNQKRRGHAGGGYIDRGYELVASAGDGGDVAMLAALFAQRAAKEGDVLSQIIFFDRGIGPDGRHQFIFVNDGSGVLHEVCQSVVSLWGQGYRLTVTPAQQTLPGVQAEGPESVNRRRPVRSHPIVGEAGIRQEGEIKMKKLVFESCAILALGFAATLTKAWAQGSPGIEGPWIENVTVHDCQSGAVVRTVRELALFIHDGSFTQAGATITGSPNPRTSGVGAWRHTAGKNYSATFQFIGLTPAGTFATMALGTRTIELNNDTWTSNDRLQFLDASGNLLGSVCSTAVAVRAPTP